MGTATAFKPALSRRSASKGPSGRGKLCSRGSNRKTRDIKSTEETGL